MLKMPADPVPGENLFLACRWPPLPVSSYGRERTTSSVASLIRTLMAPEGRTLLTSSKPDHLPKAPSPHTVYMGG